MSQTLALSLVTILLAGCAGIEAPSPLAGKPIAAPSREYRVTLHRWEVGDSLRYTLERFSEATVGARVDRRRNTFDVRYSGRRRTVEGHVQVGVFIDDLEQLWAVFDREGQFVDSTTTEETADLVVPLWRFWSAFGRYWNGRVLASDVPQTVGFPRRQVLAVSVDGGLPPESAALARDISVASRLVSYHQLAGRQTAVIEADVANVVLKPAAMWIARQRVTAEYISNESRYHVDTVRGFLVASYSLTRVTGLAGKDRFAYREIDVLQWKP